MCCPLTGYKIECTAGEGEHHHIFSKQLARGNKMLRKAIDADELVVLICTGHNHSKMADTREARRILLRHQVGIYGFERMEEVVDNLPWKVKYFEYRWENLMGGTDEVS